MRAVVLLLAGSCAFAACRPDFGERTSLVTQERVLAVRADPPEAAPGEQVTFTAIVVGPNGATPTPVTWSFCSAPKALADNDVVSSACLGVDAARPVGGPAPSTSAAIPGDACSLFGPDPPPGGYRPRDPDVTGGYYQPLRATLPGAAPAFELARIACHLANAPADAATDYGNRYRRNQNPHLAPLAASIAGTQTTLDRIPAGARVSLTAAWGAGDAESYVSFDLPSQSVVDRREAMRVSWLATAGTFDADHTGRAEDDHVTTSDDAWTAPSTAGVVHLWVVLRDSRGGLDVASYDVNVIE